MNVASQERIKISMDLSIDTSIIVMQIFAAGSAYRRFSTVRSNICRTSSISDRAFNRFGSDGREFYEYFFKLLSNDNIS